MNFTQQSIPLSSSELEELRKDFQQGCIGIAIVLLAGAGFTWMFSANIPQTSLVGKLFSWAPMVATSGIAVFLTYHLYNYKRDIKKGYKVLVTGIVTKKFIRSKSSSGTTMTKASDRIRHFILVNGENFLIKDVEYEQCSVDSNVRMYVTQYGRRVLDIDIKTEQWVKYMK